MILKKLKQSDIFGFYFYINFSDQTCRFIKCLLISAFSFIFSIESLFSQNPTRWPDKIVEIPEFKGDEDSGYDILLGRSPLGLPVIRERPITSFVEQKKWMPAEVPKKGIVEGYSVIDKNYYITFKRYPHAEGNYRFFWGAQNDKFEESNFTIELNIKGSPDPLKLKVEGEVADQNSFAFDADEEKTFIRTLYLWDPDPSLVTYSADDNSSWPILKIAETENHERFKLIRVSNSPVLVQSDSFLNGWKQEYQLRWKNPPNYEGGQTPLTSKLKLIGTDVKDNNTQRDWTFTITLKDFPEPPIPVGFNPDGFVKDEPSNRKKSSSTEARPFPADSEFYTTTDATYVLQEDSGEEILVPFTITSPDRDDSNFPRKFNIYYQADRPFDDENNATWAKLEDISVQYSKPAKFKVTEVEEDGAIKNIEIFTTDSGYSESGFGYAPEDFPLELVPVAGDANGSGGEINASVFSGGDLEGNLTIIKGGSGYKEGDLLTTPPPSGLEFNKVEETDDLINLAPSGSDGVLRIKFPLEDTFLPKTTYKFYAQDSAKEVEKDLSSSRFYPFFEADITVQNDYADPISLDRSDPPAGTDETDEVRAYRKYYKENTKLLIADYDITDPDSWPEEILRIDNNKSTQEGAKVIYSLMWNVDPLDTTAITQGSPSDYFEITNDGRLFFKEAPDYDVLGNIQNTYKLKVEVYDAASMSANHTQTSDYRLIDITITDINELNRFVDSNGFEAPVPTYYIEVAEDGIWEWSLGVQDLNRTQIDLFAKDFDFLNESNESNDFYELPIWTVADPPILGEILPKDQNRKLQSDEEYVSSRLSTPKKFIYKAFRNKVGYDSFSLDFGGSEMVQFIVNILNSPDKPVLKQIRTLSGLGKDDSIDFDESKNSHELYFDEDKLAHYRLFFADTEDNDAIQRIEVSRDSPDFEMFVISDMDVDTNGNAYVDVKMKEKIDYEAYEDKNNTFIIYVIVEDNSSLIAPNNYTFYFKNQNIEEGPKISYPNPIIKEFTSLDQPPYIALNGIIAEDPEGLDVNFSWDIAEEGNSSYFEVNPVQGDRVNLFFKDGMAPSFENEWERDLNVTIIVEDDIGGSSRTTIPIQITNANDPPYFLNEEPISVLEDRVNLIAIEDLNEWVGDEEKDPLTFRLSEVQEAGFFNYFEKELVAGKTLKFAKPADFEENASFLVSIIAKDFTGAETRDILTIEILDDAEPPELRQKDDEGKFSFDAPVLYKLEYEIQEDVKKIIDDLIFYTPQDFLRLGAENIDESGLDLSYEKLISEYGNFVVGDQGTPNGQFSYTPPPNGYTYSINPDNNRTIILRPPYQVILEVKDEITGLAEEFTFEFSVLDQPDPPEIFITNTVGDVNVSEIPDLSGELILNYEGNEDVLILTADDSNDAFPSKNYLWSLTGDDKHLFKIEPITANKRQVLLKWDLGAIGNKVPDFNKKPERQEGYVPDQYDLNVRVFGDPKSSQISELSLDLQNSSERNFKIDLLDVALQPPVFLTTTMPPYREGNESRKVGQVEAYDPDKDGLDEDEQVDIHFELLDGKESRFFEEDTFNNDGTLYFKVAPDYEQILGLGLSTILEVDVIAREFAKGDYNGQETKATIKIPLLNKVEPPFFSEIVNADNIDANFSLSEETEDTFIIFAETPDYDKNLSISISQNQEYDNHLFAISALASSDADVVQSSLFFLSPPDRESPRDYNKDNLYEVELNITTSDPSVWTLDLIKIQVDDVEYPYEVSQDQIIRVPENQAFVMDIDVEDPENLYYHPDLLVANEGGAFYLPSSYVDSAEEAQFSAQTIFPVGDNAVTLFSTAADFNNDGSTDILSISESGAKIFYNKGYGGFPKQNFLDFSDYTKTITLPKHGVVEDFDHDGDQDVVLAYYSNNGKGNASVYYFENRINEDGNFTFGRPLGINWLEPKYLHAMDVDGDYNLDLVVADFAKDEVVWLSNNGKASFSFGGVVADSKNGLLEPRCLEPLDLDQVAKTLNDQAYNKPDLLIGAKGKILVAENDGKGEFLIKVVLDDFIYGAVTSIRALELDDDSKTDFVFVEKDKGNAFFSMGYNDYNNSQPVVTDNLNLSLSTPSSLAVYNYLDSEKKVQSLILLGASTPNSSIPRIYQFGPVSRTDNNAGWEFAKFDTIEFPAGSVAGNLNSLEVADLDRAYNTYQFSIEDTLNFEEFDHTRIRANGRLFFSQESIPDYENPLPGSENLYKIYVNYFKNGSDTPDTQQKELFQIEIIDVNEHPVLLDFNGTVSGVYQHLENIQSVGQVLFDNPESHSDAEQKVEFSIIEEKDFKFFDINRTSGELFFKNAPDREEPKGKIDEFADEDHFYQVTVQVKENSLDEYNDTKTYLIEVIDGPENPVFDPDLIKLPGTGIDIPAPSFGSKVSISLQTEEDSDGDLVILMEDLNLSDPNPGGSFTHLFVSDDASHGDIHFMIDGNETALKQILFPDPQTFDTDIRKINMVYIPDANFSGNDAFTIQANSVSGIPARLKVEMSVTPVNDPPAFFETITDTIYRSEGVRKILTLKGVDSDQEQNPPEDVGSLNFELLDSFDSDYFRINKNLVETVHPLGLDYEEKTRYQFELLLTSGSTNQRVKEVRKIIELRVINEPDQPPVSLALEESARISVYEGQRSIQDLKLLDPDGFSPVQASILEGFDSELFLLTQLDELMTVNPRGLTYNPNNPAKNFFDVHLFLEDGDKNNTYQISIEVLDLDETPPVILSGNSRASHELSVPENTVFVYELLAQDIEKEVLEYTIEKGFDGDLFKLEVPSNQSASVSFKDPPNFESPISDGGQYKFVVGVSDGLNLVEQLVKVTVTDANDPPVLTNHTFNLLEDDQSFKRFLEVSDEDNDSVTISIKEPTSHGTVSILSKEIFYVPNEDFYGTDQMVLSLSDGTDVSAQTIYFEVEGVNDPPIAVDDFVYFYSSSLRANPTIFIDVRDNDHSGPDPSEERNSYTFKIKDSTSQKGGSIGYDPLNKGIFKYTIPENLLGEDNFQYEVKDQGLSHVGNVKVWVAKSASSPEWTSLYYFGTFYQDPNDFGSNWIFHTDIGWVFVDQPDKILEATWMWRESIGWFWTGDKYFKWVYHDEFKKWLHWERGINYSGGWFLRDVDENAYYEKDFIRFRVRNDIIEILPDLDALSNYIYLNGYFSSSEIKTILTELALRGNSPTLNRLLQFDFSY